jgi:hypothetical protein
VLDECVFISGGTALQLNGSNLGLRMQQCLAAVGQNLLHLDNSGLKVPLLNAHCLLEQNTLAAKKALIRLDGPLPSGAPPDPCIIVSRNNVFWAPFTETKPPQPKSGLLLCSGEALPHGQFIWYGAGNVYDKRLHYEAAVIDAVPVTPQPLSTWGSLWGCPDDVSLVLDGKDNKFMPQITLNFRDQVETLQLPTGASSRQPPPGADFYKIGVLKKPKGS